MVAYAVWIKIRAASLTFQLLIKIFAGMLGKIVFAYLDYIIGANKDSDTHLDNLELVFQKLQKLA